MKNLRLRELFLDTTRLVDTTRRANLSSQPEHRDVPARAPRTTELLNHSVAAVQRALRQLPHFLHRALCTARANSLFTVIVIVPTLLATVYFGLIASDRYVSVASFVVRSASSHGSAGSLGSFLKVTGIVQSQDDAFAVHEFMISREAVREVEEKLPLRKMYALEGVDFLSRYPSLIFGASHEELYRYYRNMVEVTVHPASGISTLKVQAFTPDDAQTIARTLLDLGEKVVNRMNARIQQDAVRFAEADVIRTQERLIASQIALTAFRNRELMIDPGKSSVAMMNLVGQLSTDLASTLSHIREIEALSPDSPQLPSLHRRVAALQGQIDQERGRVSTHSDGLADKIAEFERLSLEHGFATRAQTAAISALENARIEARRQHLYLERVVEPHLSDDPGRPYRVRNIAVTFGGGLVLFLIVWLVASGVREHGHSPN